MNRIGKIEFPIINPLRAHLVGRAEDWQFGSLWRWSQKVEPLPKLPSPWPIARAPNWKDRVNEPLSDQQLQALRTCVGRGRPFGNPEWTEKVARRTGLAYTLRPHGRPRKQQP